MNMGLRRFHNRVLAILFAVVMMVTSTPQTYLQAMAAQESTGITEADKADGDAIFHGNSTKLEGIIAGTGDDPAGTEEYVTYTFQPGEHVRICNEEGTEEITKISVLKGSEDMHPFKIVVDEGYVIGRVSYDKKAVRVRHRLGENYKNALYDLFPTNYKNMEPGYQVDASIEVTAVPVAEHKVSFRYNPEQVEMSVTKTQGKDVVPVTLNPDAAVGCAEFTITNEYDLDFEVKYKPEYYVSRVEWTEGDDKGTLEKDIDESTDGCFVYSYGRVFSDAAIEIVTGDKVSITWKKPVYMEIGRAIKLNPDEYNEDEGESPFEVSYDDIWYGGTTKLIKGEPVYFYVTLDGSMGYTVDYTGRWYLTTTGDESGEMEIVGRTGLDGLRVFCITPEQDMVITGIVPPHTISFVCDADVKVEQLFFTDNQEDFAETGTQATFAENKKSMGIYHDTGVELTFSGTAGRTYTIYQIVRELCDGYDEQGEYYEYYVDVRQELQKITLEGTAGQTATGKFDFMASGEVKAVGITSGTMENASRKLTFDAPHADIYVSVDGGAAEKLGSAEMIVPKDAGVRFRVAPREGYRVVYVSATEDAAGALEAQTDESGLSWYEVTAAEDRKLKIVTEEITAEKKDVYISYDSLALVSITARADGREIPATIENTDDFGMRTAVYQVPVGSILSLTAAAGERYTIQNVQIDGLVHETDKTTWTGAIAVEDNVAVTVETKGETYAVLSLIKGEREEALPDAGMYDLYQGKAYSVRLYCGKRAAKLDAPVVSGKALSARIDPEDDTRVLLETMGIVKNGIKSTLKLTGTVTAGSSLQINAALQCRIVETLESVTVKGPETCTVDARSVYTVTASPVSAGTTGIGAEVVMEPGMASELLTADFVGSTGTGRLNVTVSSKAPVGQKLAVVKLYRRDCEPGEADYYIRGGSIDIIAGEPTALKSFTPQVSLVSSDDISLTVAFQGADEIGGCIRGSQYYRIEVTPKAADGSEIPASIKAATEQPVYVLRELPEESGDEGESTKTPAFVQKARIIVNHAPSGKGQKWDYELKVTLVQTGDKTPLVPESENAQILYRSQSAQTQEFSTKDPSFSVKVGVKKLSSTIYTTQQDLAAAGLTYDVNAACTGAVAADITDCSEDEKLSVYVADDRLYVSAFSGTSLGKHTIEIIPVGPETMYQKPVNFVITVVKGIETLRLDVPTQRIYRQAGKPAKVKTTAVCNAFDTAAKTKKVSWSIVDVDGMALDTENPMYGKVTVKNGTVSVAKTLSADEDAEYNFCVKAQAADFKGNRTSAVSPVITITSAPMEDFGSLIIVTKNEETSRYEVVAKDGSTVTSDKLESGELIALSKDAEVKESYSLAELQSSRIDPSLFTVKSSSPKALNVRNDNGSLALSVSKIAKNVKLTVTAKDGSKKSTSVKLSVQYAKPDRLAFGVYADNTVLNDPAVDNKTALTFKGSVNTVVNLQLMEQTGSAPWKNVPGYTNHTVKVKGGKLLTGDAKHGQYQVVVTSDKATVTLTDKDHKVSTAYVITNTGYSTAKAPKIKVKVGTAAKLKAGAAEGRKMIYEIGSGYDGVLVEADKLSEQKNSKSYSALENACDQMWQVAVVKNGAFELTFDGGNVPAGSYKLTLTPVKSAAGVYEAASKPVNITLKVQKPKAVKGSYKPQTTYTMKADAGSAAVLSGKGSNLKSVTFDTLMGMNVKGKENNFLRYFELKDGKLVLKAGLTAEQIAALKADKNDQKGYVTYTAVYGDNGYGVPTTVRRTVMITVRLK